MKMNENDVDGSELSALVEYMRRADADGSSTPPAGEDRMPRVQRRIRRTRRIRAAALATPVIALAVAAATLLPASSQDTGLSADGPASGPGPSSAPATGAPTADAAGPADTRVATTGPALLAVLLDALPPGEKAGDFAANSGDYPTAQAYLTDARGTRQITVTLTTPYAERVCSSSGGDSSVRCFRDSRGQQVRISHIPSAGGSCTRTVTVTVAHPDGRDVEIEMFDCPTKEGGTRPPGTAALTEDQAVALAGNPAFSLQMDSRFVQAAADRFPDLPRIKMPFDNGVSPL
ncbi:hypothetical protein ABZW30_29555 [Kitasatospora sp. NPDC004669]|uniref:hypothetical protein n=1 Tax=Kitasatospora sp. NPDC004669 TaxID=3154555 RepID=UPI0033B0E5E7